MLDGQPAPGTVELREDAPLKTGAGAGGACGACCAGGPRLVLASFAVLTAAITLALATQIYSGDYELVPHGSVSSSAAECSRAGTDALKAGGRALDAAAAAALCLAVCAPHRTALDASGSLLYWEYRQSRTVRPTLAEWGAGGGPSAVGGPSADGGPGARPPRLVAALAALHAEHGALPWPRLLQPAILLARNGFEVSESFAQALAERAAREAAATGAGAVIAAPAAGSVTTAPELADYLETLQFNSSAELSAAWGGGGVRAASAAPAAAGRWRVFAGSGAAPAARALALALDPPPADVDDASKRVLSAMEQLAGAGTAWEAGGVASGLAVVDRLDTYLALVTGLSVAFGSGPVEAAGWARDEPPRALDLAPAIMVDERVCGTRFVVGGESGAALAQAAAVLGGGGGAAGVERARSAWRGTARVPEAPPRAAVNVVQQAADALLSHADSRGGGLASRF